MDSLDPVLAPPIAVDSSAAEQPIVGPVLEADSIERTARDSQLRPRIWLVPLVVFACLGCYFVASVVAVVVAAVAVHGPFNPARFRELSFIESVTQSPIGFPVMVVLPQIVMTIPVLVAAHRSPLGFRQRLRLVAGDWPVWTWICAAVATPLVGMTSAMIVGMFMEDSESLVEMTLTFRQLANDGYLIPLVLLVGATPGVCEELVFRGYVQSRLTARSGGALGILLTSIVFAIFHLDLVHSTAVFAIGAWLGWLCWQSGSIFPAMLAHFTNNAVSVFAVALGPEPGSDDVNLALALIMFAVFMLGFAGLVATIAAAWRLRRMPGSLDAIAAGAPTQIRL